MNKIYRIALVGPTGAGKSQFCNFLLNDLSNSKHKVSDSLNSCTTQPQSTIMERNNIKLELIDSPGNSDSNNNDEENLKVLVDYLRNKKELNQIFLVLSFEDRLSRDTRDYLKILSYIFTPKEFMSNLMVIFTHYPINPDEDEKNKLNKLKNEINEILNKLFDIKNYMKNPEIPANFLNTKIFKHSSNFSFDDMSKKASIDLIDELKLRLRSYFYSPIDTSDLICDKEVVKKKAEIEFRKLQQEMENLQKLQKRNNDLKNQSAKQNQINLELEQKIIIAKKEEEEHRNFINNMQSENRTTLNDSGIGGIGIAIFGMVIGTVVGGCKIF